MDGPVRDLRTLRSANKADVTLQPQKRLSWLFYMIISMIICNDHLPLIRPTRPLLPPHLPGTCPVPISYQVPAFSGPPPANAGEEREKVRPW